MFSYSLLLLLKNGSVKGMQDERFADFDTGIWV